MSDAPLPNGWHWATLGEVSRIFAGSTAPQDKKYFSAAGPRFVRVSDLSLNNGQKFLAKTTSGLSEAAINELNLVRAPQDTVIFPKSGAAVATNNRAILNFDAFIVSHLMGVKTNPELDASWCYYYLSQIDMTKLGSNPAYPSLTQEDVAKISLPLPPVEEQRRIANRHDILFERAARMVTELAAECSQLEALLSALVYQNFDHLSQNFPSSTLHDACVSRPQYGLSLRSSKNGDVAFLKMFNIEPNATSLAKLDHIQNEQVPVEFLLDDGDILFNRTNSAELVGKTAVWDRNARATFASYLIRLKIDRSMFNSYFLSEFINSAFGREFIEKTMGRAIGQVNVKASSLAKMPAPIPPLAIQNEFVERIRSVRALAKDIQRVLAGRRLEAHALRSSLLCAAFSGQL